MSYKGFNVQQVSYGQKLKIEDPQKILLAGYKSCHTFVLIWAEASRVKCRKGNKLLDRKIALLIFWVGNSTTNMVRVSATCYISPKKKSTKKGRKKYKKKEELAENMMLATTF